MDVRVDVEDELDRDDYCCCRRVVDSGHCRSLLVYLNKKENMKTKVSDEDRERERERDHSKGYYLEL